MNFLNIFKKKEEKPKVEFWSVVPGMELVEPPVPSNKCIPDWFKKIPRNLDQYSGRSETVKKCPALVDFFKEGYILKMWVDLELTVNEDSTYYWKAAENRWQFENQGQDQFINYLPDSDQYSMILKAICPWRVRTSPGWAIMQLPLFYHYNPDFTALPGIIWSDIHHDISQHLAFYKYGKFVIPRGTPLCMLFPFKRDAVDYEVGHMTQERSIATEAGYHRWSGKFKEGYTDFRKSMKKGDIS